MPVRITGLNSGLDTDSIVKELVKSYSGQKDNIKKQQTKLEWKQEAWKELNTKVYNFYSSQLSNMRLASAYQGKSAKSSDETKATVKASSSTPIGAQKLEISQIAQAGYLTGSKVTTKTGVAATAQTGLDALGLKGSTTLSVKVGDKTTKVDVSASDTIQSVVEKFRNAGLNASFDKDSQRFFISSKESGAAGDFSITAENYASISGAEVKIPDSEDYATRSTTAAQLGITSAVDLKVKVNGKEETVHIEPTDEIFKIEGKFEATGLKASFKDGLHKFVLTNDTGEDVDFELVDGDETQEKAFKALGLKGEGAAKHTSYGNDALDALGLMVRDESEYKETHVKGIQGSAISASNDTSLSELGIVGEKVLKIKVNGETKEIKLNADNPDGSTDDKIFMLIGKLEEAGVKARFDQDTKKIVLAQYTQDDPDFELVVDAGTRDTLSKLGLLGPEDGGIAKTFTDPDNETLESLGLPAVPEKKGSAVKVDGQDAIIKLNGAEFTSKDGNFSINGLNITAIEKTDSPITINTTVDSQGIYDSIKSFFKEYNELIKEMDTLFNADSSKGYEPLTDEEKDELSDTEVEKWEKKIKDSLLRRDQTLNSVADVLKNAMAKTYTINGKSYSLSSFGIKTQAYLSAGKNEKYLYHIDGDSDDSLTKTNEDKLMSAINSDPDGVAEFFSQLVKGAYSALDSKMRSTSMSSAYVVYNDKQITKDLQEYKTKLDKWEDKVKYYEDFYFKKFSGMEKALATLQSSQNSLSMLLGQ